MKNNHKFQDKKESEGGTMTYTLTTINTVADAIPVLQCLDDTLKFYWINALQLSDAEKGKLLIYFNL